MDSLHLSYDVLYKPKLCNECLDHLKEEKGKEINQGKQQSQTSIKIYYEAIFNQLLSKNLLRTHGKSFKSKVSYNFFGVEMENIVSENINNLADFIKSITVQQNIISSPNSQLSKESINCKDDVLDIFPSPSQFYKEIYKEDRIFNKTPVTSDSSNYLTNLCHEEETIKYSITDDANLSIFLKDEEEILDCIDEHNLSNSLLNISLNDIKNELIDINELKKLDNASASKGSSFTVPQSLNNVAVINISPCTQPENLDNALKVESSPAKLICSEEEAVNVEVTEHPKTGTECSSNDNNFQEENIIIHDSVENKAVGEVVNVDCIEECKLKSDAEDIQIIAEIFKSLVKKQNSEKEADFSSEIVLSQNISNREVTNENENKDSPCEKGKSNENIQIFESKEVCVEKKNKELSPASKECFDDKLIIVENKNKKVKLNENNIVDSPTNITDQYVNVQEEKLYLKPFESTNESENKDINDPNWNIYRNLKTDEERYLKVREHWKNVTVPDPNTNLTYHGYRYRHNSLKGYDSCENTHKCSPKRRRESEDESLLPFNKRLRTFQDLTFNSRAIENTLCLLNMNFESFKRNATLGRNRANKLNYIYRDYVRQLRNAQEEAEMVHKFYIGLPDQKALTQEELEREQSEIEHVYNLFKRFYNWSGNVFNPVLGKP